MFEPWLKRWAFIDDDTLAEAGQLQAAKLAGLMLKT
ncbi:hypothetical protein QF010_006141 [Pseudomonas silensiensis]